MPNIEENMRLADVVRGSMEDFGYLYGLQDGDAIYERVSHYCQTLILTDGARTIRVYTPEGCETYPVQAIETVSTVGAGDNFNAGYIYAMLQGMVEPLYSLSSLNEYHRYHTGKLYFSRNSFK